MVLTSYLDELREFAKSDPTVAADVFGATPADWDARGEVLYNPVASVTMASEIITTDQAGVVPAPEAAAKVPKLKSKREARIWDGFEIFSMEFPEPAWVVEGIIPAGLTLLAGPPKKGKSWFALELAQAICSNGYFLGRKVTPGRVLYCALEDSQRRFHERQHKQGWTAEAAKSLRVAFDADFRGLFGNTSSRFATFARDAGFDFVIIDTITRAFSIRDWNDQALAARAVAPLQELASEGAVSILVIDHHHKRGLLSGDDDPVHDIIGSTSKGAIADTILGLYKDQGKPGARLAITGRDIEEQTLNLRFDMASGSWQVTDAVSRLTQQQKEAIEAIQALDGTATLGDLAKALECDKGNLYRRLVALEDLGLVAKDKSTWRLKAD